jgi:hypothetical protein
MSQKSGENIVGWFFLWCSVVVVAFLVAFFSGRYIDGLLATVMWMLTGVVSFGWVLAIIGAISLSRKSGD